MDTKLMGSRLRECRESKHLTIDEASKAIGIKASTLNAYELGYRIPKDITKKLISDYYRKSIKYLFFG